MSVLTNLDRIYQLTMLDRLALESLVLTGRPAATSFRQWLDGIDLESISAASSRLVPALFARHAKENPRLPHYGRMKSLFQFAHVRNSMVLEAAWKAVALLQQRGLTVMVFKGASLALKYYRRLALRPMGDVDIIVPEAEYPEANAILQEQGWRYRYLSHERLAEHSCDYLSATGQAIDLHERPLLEVSPGQFDERLFERAQPFDWHGLKLLVPCPEDEVLIGLVNAMRELGAVRLEWLCDLVRVLEATPTFDWHLLWDQAQAFGVAKQVFHALQIAGDLRGLEFIADVQSGLLTGSRFEREYLTEAVAMGRTFGIPEAARSAVNRIIAPSDQGDARYDVKHDWWAEATDRQGPIGTIRVLETERREIKGLYLRWRYLPLVPSLFRIVDRDAWDETCRGCPTRGDGVLDVKPGLIEMRDDLPPEAYRATITIDTSLPSAMKPGERLAIHARVANDSSHPWGSLGFFRPFGFSWHLFRNDDSILQWDMRRDHFFLPMLRERNIVFLEPGAVINCSLPFKAPTDPDDYLIKFDVVHEHVTWFSSSEHSFPKWRVTVC